MTVGLNGSHKSNITQIETDITTALASLTDPRDTSQLAARSALEAARRCLVPIAIERAQ